MYRWAAYGTPAGTSMHRVVGAPDAGSAL